MGFIARRVRHFPAAAVFKAVPIRSISFATRTPARRQRQLAATPKDLLFSFAGRGQSSRAPATLCSQFYRADVLVEDTSSYNHFAGQTENHRVRAGRRYWEMAGVQIMRCAREEPAHPPCAYLK